MCMIGISPPEQLMRELAARQKARKDWAYADEMQKLRGDDSQNPTDGEPPVDLPGGVGQI